MAKKLPNPKYIPKPYEKMKYPGQRVRIDVKFVPQTCLLGDAVCDAGEIIAQFKVALSPDDTVDDIAEKEHQLEMAHFPKVVEEIIRKMKE